MRILELKQKLGYSFKGVYTEIKNNNELYLTTPADKIREIVKTLLLEYKLSPVAEFCRQDEGFIINVVLTNRKQGYFVVLRYPTQNEVITLADNIFQFNLFEREMADLFGLSIVGGSDQRNLVKHEIWEKNVFPLRKQFPYGQKIKQSEETEDYAFKGLSGEGGYQIAVGPVHAGVIEPGHFRFSAIGEQIENLEIRLMYKHRGIEKICENIDANKLNLIFERVAGESSVAYGEAYALLVEKLTGFTTSEDIKILRTVLLELERIYNFLDDIAGICVDVGFSYPAKKYGYFSEQIHQLAERLTGNRFFRNAIVPCGSAISFTKESAADVCRTLERMEKRMNKIIEMTIDTVTFLDRVENTGVVYNEKAKKLNMTGIVGRASDIKYDVRTAFSYEKYKELKKNVNMETLGGVFERYKLKIAEIRDAFKLIPTALSMIKEEIKSEKNGITLSEGLEGLVAVETVKGELVVYGKVGENNRFTRVYFKTPSFTNWNGLTYAVMNEIVPDFPLCNKSFNMSYSENDR